MRYSIEPKDRIYVKGYGFIVKNFLIVQKKSRTDAVKTASKRAIQKTAGASGDLIGNKIADKVTSVSKKSFTCSQNNEANHATETRKERYIFPE